MQNDPSLMLLWVATFTGVFFVAGLIPSIVYHICAKYKKLEAFWWVWFAALSISAIYNLLARFVAALAENTILFSFTGWLNVFIPCFTVMFIYYSLFLPWCSKQHVLYKIICLLCSAFIFTTLLFNPLLIPVRYNFCITLAFFSILTAYHFLFHHASFFQQVSASMKIITFIRYIMFSIFLAYFFVH